MGCTEAVLIYPTRSHIAIDQMAGGIHVRTLAFDLDRAGNQLLIDLIEHQIAT